MGNLDPMKTLSKYQGTWDLILSFSTFHFRKCDACLINLIYRPGLCYEKHCSRKMLKANLIYYNLIH